MLKELIKVANSLDAKGLYREADALDNMIKEVQEKESLTDVAIRQEKERKRKQLARESYRKLTDAASWFKDHIWVSTDSKFPVVTPELYIGVRHSHWHPRMGYPRMPKAERVIIPAGTEFTGMEDEMLTTDGERISLGEAGNLLEENLVSVKRVADI